MRGNNASIIEKPIIGEVLKKTIFLYHKVYTEAVWIVPPRLCLWFLESLQEF